MMLKFYGRDITYCAFWKFCPAEVIVSLTHQ